MYIYIHTQLHIHINQTHRRRDARPIGGIRTHPSENHRLPDGVGTNGVSQKGRIPPTCCHSLCVKCACSYVATCCNRLPYFPMKVDEGKSRHFCDDPVCPDPVWKPSREPRDGNQGIVIVIVIVMVITLYFGPCQGGPPQEDNSHALSMSV